jgi:hypothetical protein
MRIHTQALYFPLFLDRPIFNRKFTIWAGPPWPLNYFDLMTRVIIPDAVVRARLRADPIPASSEYIKEDKVSDRLQRDCIPGMVLCQ